MGEGPPALEDFTLSPASREDASTLARIHAHAEACYPDLLLRLQYPNMDTFRRYVEHSIRDLFSKGNGVWMKACNEEGEIMGWANWLLPRDAPESVSSMTEAEPKRGDGSSEHMALDIRRDFPTRPGLDEFLAKYSHNVRKEFLKDRKCLYFMGPFTLPQYQRHGIGTALVRWGHDFADTRGLLTHLAGTPFGYSLYVKMGWKEFGRLDIDLSHSPGSAN